MIYRDKVENRRVLKPGMKLWACAYTFDSNKETMRYICKPTYGEIKGYGFGYKDDYNDNDDDYPAWFIPFNKKNEFISSKRVQVDSRVYADTYEECVVLYNILVNERINYFKERIEKTTKDLIEC